MTEVPYIIQVLHGSSFICGGSILTPKLILTAAHCVEEGPISEYNVAGGQLDLQNIIRYPTQIQPVIKYIKCCEKYNNFTNENDLIILELKNELKFNSYINSVMLSSSEQFINPTPYSTMATIYGWGLTDKFPFHRGKLKKATIPILPESECCKAFNHTCLGFKSKKLICAKDLIQNIGSCVGDSGGPLMCHEKQEDDNSYYQKYLCGITSFGGSEHCTSEHPDGYVNVDYYLNWIKRVVESYPSSTQTKEVIIEELPKTPSCEFDEFQCKNGECIALKYKCDNDADCEDNSDEDPKICLPSCSSDQFQCKNGKCIRSKYKCDRRNDCGDNSDEEVCWKQEDQFPIRKNPTPKENVTFQCTEKSIHVKQRCDGILDCKSGEDELGCNSCKENEIYCSAIVDKGKKCVKTKDICYFRIHGEF